VEDGSSYEPIDRMSEAERLIMLHRDPARLGKEGKKLQ
jgi:hypothetical protein